MPWQAHALTNASDDTRPLALVGIGANLPSPSGPPLATFLAAVSHLDCPEFVLVGRSRLYRSAPLPATGQPDFLNAVLAFRALQSPRFIIDRLLATETLFGRQRRVRWDARSLDLDLISVGDIVLPTTASWSDHKESETKAAVLPHPRAHLRRFVLQPLRDLCPHWRHPVLGFSVDALLRRIADPQPISVIHDHEMPSLLSDHQPLTEQAVFQNDSFRRHYGPRNG